MKLLLILSLLTNSALAEDCVSCSKELAPFEGLIKNIESLQSPTIIDCSHQLKMDAKEEYLEHFAGLPQKKGLFKDLTLEGSAEELLFLRKMLNDKPTFQWSEASGCTTVLCVLTRVYQSEESAHRVLNIAKRDGYIVSLSQDFNFESKDMGQLFSPREIQKIDLAFKQLPAPFKKLRSLDRLKRMPDGRRSPRSPKAAAYAIPKLQSSYYSAEGEISFMDSGATGNAWAPLVAIHELAHHVDYSSSDKTNYGISESAEFKNLSGWTKKTTYDTDKVTGKKIVVVAWEHAAGKKFITDYAGTKPSEDFAESVAHYVYFPKKFKSIDPNKYEFIKNNVFAGKEYMENPELGVSEAELLKICLQNNKVIHLHDNAGHFLPISSYCLDNYFKDFKYTDPRLCSHNIDQIKNYVEDRMLPVIDGANGLLKKCNQQLVAFREECMSEGNFQGSCALDKCQMSGPLRAKVKDTSIFDRSSSIMNAVSKRLGRQNVLATALISGLAEKNKVTNQFALTMQKDFLENAAAGLSAAIAQENLKFDTPEEARQKAHNFVMMDKAMNDSIRSFQKDVLKNASSSKEKNLKLIKAWAAAESLEDTPLYEQLAQTLENYGGGLFGWK